MSVLHWFYYVLLQIVPPNCCQIERWASQPATAGFCVDDWVLFRSHPAAVFLRSLHWWFFSRRSNAALFSWIIDLLLLARVQESTQRFFSASQRVSSKKKLPMDTEKLLLIWIYSSTRISKKVPSCSACSSFSRSMSAWPNEICASCNVEGYARNNESAWMQDGCLAFSCFRCCSQFSHPKDLCLPNIQNCWKFHSTWTVATIFPCLGLCSRLQFFLLQLLRNVQRRMYDIHTDWHVIC